MRCVLVTMCLDAHYVFCVHRKSIYIHVIISYSFWGFILALCPFYFFVSPCGASSNVLMAKTKIEDTWWIWKPSDSTPRASAHYWWCNLTNILIASNLRVSHNLVFNHRNYSEVNNTTNYLCQWMTKTKSYYNQVETSTTHHER